MTIIGLIILLLPAVSVKATWVLVLLHFAVILLVMDLIAWLIHKIWKEKEFPILWKRLYRSGVIAALLTCAVFVYGTYNIYHVIQTDYTVETAKAIREDGYKILVVSDLHYGITLNQEQLQEEVTKMSGENADIVILDGDIVDESTTQTQMQEAFQTLGKIANKYGVYYVYGNHDQNNYTSHPNYGRDEQAAAWSQDIRNFIGRDPDGLLRDLDGIHHYGWTGNWAGGNTWMEIHFEAGSAQWGFRGPGG